MKRWQTLAVIALLSFQAAAGAADLVAVVDLKFIAATDRTAAVMCFGDDDEDCVVWATSNLYRAKIRKIISGSESRNSVLVLFGRHALKEGDIRGVTAAMNRLEVETDGDPEYQITNWGTKRELVCFARLDDDPVQLELKEGEESFACYEEE